MDQTDNEQRGVSRVVGEVERRNITTLAGRGAWSFVIRTGQGGTRMRTRSDKMQCAALAADPKRERDSETGDRLNDGGGGV